MKKGLASILDKMPIENCELPEKDNRSDWIFWQEGLKEKKYTTRKITKIEDFISIR